MTHAIKIKNSKKFHKYPWGQGNREDNKDAEKVFKHTQMGIIMSINY